MGGNAGNHVCFYTFLHITTHFSLIVEIFIAAKLSTGRGNRKIVKLPKQL